MNRKLFSVVSDDRFWNEQSGKFYLGIDPTGDGLHIGHLIPIKLALTLLHHGFNGILLIGGFTGKIGDPTDKLEARKKLEDQSAENYSKIIFEDLNRIFKPFQKQISLVNNKDWLDNFTIGDYLSIAYQISLTKKLHLETFDNRLRNNLSLSAAEFLYPDIQMIDFLYLFNQYQCNIQIGGADQWGNISYGVHHVKKITKQENIFGLCTPLLTSENKKISKSEGKPPFVKDPAALYQFCLRAPLDTCMQIRDIFAPEIMLSPHITKEERAAIAKEIIKICYPESFDSVFRQIIEEAEAVFYKDIHEISEDLLTVTSSGDIISTINSIDQNWSKAELKRKLAESAISIDNKTINENILLLPGKYKIKIGSKTIFCVWIKE